MPSPPPREVAPIPARTQHPEPVSSAPAAPTERPAQRQKRDREGPEEGVEVWRKKTKMGRPIQNCDACRKGRNKCDRKALCGECQMRGRECTYRDAGPLHEPTGSTALEENRREIKRLKYQVNVLVKFLRLTSADLTDLKKKAALPPPPLSTPPLPAQPHPVAPRPPPAKRVTGGSASSASSTSFETAPSSPASIDSPPPFSRKTSPSSRQPPLPPCQSPPPCHRPLSPPTQPVAAPASSPSSNGSPPPSSRRSRSPAPPPAVPPTAGPLSPLPLALPDRHRIPHPDLPLLVPLPPRRNRRRSSSTNPFPSRSQFLLRQLERPPSRSRSLPSMGAQDPALRHLRCRERRPSASGRRGGEFRRRRRVQRG